MTEEKDTVINQTSNLENLNLSKKTETDDINKNLNVNNTFTNMLEDVQKEKQKKEAE